MKQMGAHLIDKPTADNDIATKDKFSGYIAIQTNLDNLIWKNVAVFLTIATLGLAGLGTIFEKHIAVAPLTSDQTAGVLCMIIWMLMTNTIFTLRRMRFHHELIESELRNLESCGYFHSRLKSTVRWWLAAPFWTRILFMLIAAGFLVLGIHLIGPTMFSWPLLGFGLIVLVLAGAKNEAVD